MVPRFAHKEVEDSSTATSKEGVGRVRVESVRNRYYTCHISDHTLYTHILHMHILHAYAYDYMHMSPILDRHLTFSLTALCNISHGLYII